jgi:hypothetical protein
MAATAADDRAPSVEQFQTGKISHVRPVEPMGAKLRGERLTTKNALAAATRNRRSADRTISASDAMTALFHEAEVRKALALLIEPGAVFEVRALDAQLNGQRYAGTVFGYFDSINACVDALQNLQSAVGIYVMLNPVNPALLARARNRLKYARKSDATTVDRDIERRTSLLIDVDPVRPSGISATDAEKAKAIQKAREIYSFLKALKWPQPVCADSGNGGHLKVAVDLPADDGGLCEKVLALLADHFDDDTVKIDRTVHNPARIGRLYGTLAAKGDHTEERPHRMSQVLAAPKQIEVVTEEQLRALVDRLKPEQPKSTRTTTTRDKPDKQTIRDILAVIPKRPHYGGWITIVAAVGDALPEEDAIELLQEWSPEEKAGEYAAKLRSGLTEVHIGTLIHLAREYGWTGNLRISPRVEAEVDDPSGGLTSLSSLDVAPYPAPIDEAAYYGLAGEIVRRILPQTEADPVALLVQFLVGFGNIIGRKAYMLADGARHYLNMFVVLVGETSKGRKGTAWRHIYNILQQVDEEWCKNIASGLSSGEGLIWAVRDKITKTVKGKKTGKYETEIVDAGIEDKRLLVIETEFANVLKAMTREGNTLSPVIRSAFDSGNLRTLTKNSPARATEAHVSIVGHITRLEARRELTETESANGFGNRICWVAVRRSKCLPEGGQAVGIADLVVRLQDTVKFAKTCGELKRDDAARELWARVYPTLSEGKRGLLGAITARAEAQVLRFSESYALLDCSTLVTVDHLRAALALWDYCDRSAKWTFETGTGNKNADKILAALNVAGARGLSKSEITTDVFNRNATKFEIDEALRLLHALNLAWCKQENTATRPAERWFLQARPYEEYEESPHEQTKTGDTSYHSYTSPSQNASSGDSEPEPEVAAVPAEVNPKIPEHPRESTDKTDQNPPVPNSVSSSGDENRPLVV